MVSTSLMVDTSSHPRAQLHRCVERSAYLDGGAVVSKAGQFVIVSRAKLTLGGGLPDLNNIAHRGDRRLLADPLVL
jgi:hypothetical protein